MGRKNPDRLPIEIRGGEQSSLATVAHWSFSFRGELVEEAERDC
jgi:hypothetical protein